MKLVSIIWMKIKVLLKVLIKEAPHDKTAFSYIISYEVSSLKVHDLYALMVSLS